MENQTTKKILTRMHLVNWHYFQNDRMEFNGSALISGLNTAGKSTILDAMQLVLTQNTTKFNAAANEKSNRTLKGYVRCKTDDSSNPYMRKNTVPANIALEFYEEKTDKYFVLGAHMTSEENDEYIDVKWYSVECRLDDLSFIVDNRPALAHEFTVNGNKIKYIEKKYEAKARFAFRLGHLDDRFYSIIPKALAFKPMDNVKAFINQFILKEYNIDVSMLRQNLDTLQELENTLDRCKKEYSVLENILQLKASKDAKEQDVRANTVIEMLAYRDFLQENIEEINNKIRSNTNDIEDNQSKLLSMQKTKKELADKLMSIELAIQSNSSHKLIAEIENRIMELQEDIEDCKKQEKKLQAQLINLKKYACGVQALGYTMLTASELNVLAEVGNIEQKTGVLRKIEEFNDKYLEEIRKTDMKYQLDLEQLDADIEELEKRLRELEHKKLKYPTNVVKLKEQIEQEFRSRMIQSKVYILAELLEITDSVWTNAIEGYLNSQKFYLIVEPQYYDIALAVYHKNRDNIYSAGIVNTKKIPLEGKVEDKSLATVVRSENIYAKAYIDYVLGRVFRCDSMAELENYPVAITSDCMLYKSYVVRAINPAHYKNPFIGHDAFSVQAKNVAEQKAEKHLMRQKLRESKKAYSAALESKKLFDFTLLKQNAFALDDKESAVLQLEKEQEEHKKASKDPSLIQLQLDKEEKKKEQERIDNSFGELQQKNGRLQNAIEYLDDEKTNKQEKYLDILQALEHMTDEDTTAFRAAETSYAISRKTKQLNTLMESCKHKKVRLEKELGEFETQIARLQYTYNDTFHQDYKVGSMHISQYSERLVQLRTIDIVQNESRTQAKKKECETIFKTDFLSKMKEAIENAYSEFNHLNKALKNIYYGHDWYEFELTPNKQKESFYQMIMAKENFEGFNLWTASYEEKYREEMNELFDKLIIADDSNQKVLLEYTDYRSYLDYDIKIMKRNRKGYSRFSEIYGEKSGGETQVPFYVAIAASFYQLYRHGNTIRLMLFDEAFNNLDAERINSVLKFFKELDLQPIIATPPEKIETIGEVVDSVITIAQDEDGNRFIGDYKL